METLMRRGHGDTNAEGTWRHRCGGDMETLMRRGHRDTNVEGTWRH